jgi:hypothetical protein
MNRIGFLGYHPVITGMRDYLSAIEGATISGCYAGYPLDAEMLKSKGFRLYESLNELLDSSDAIVCLHEDGDVLRSVEKIIKYRKHIYINSLYDYQQDYLHHLVKLVDEAAIISQVNVELLFNNVIRKLSTIVSNPQMLEIDLGGYLLKDREKLVSNSSLISICILVQQLVKQRIKRLHVQRITVAENNSEALNIRFDFHNGCVSNLMLDGVQDINIQTLKIYQKQSYIIANLPENTLLVHHHKENRVRVKGDQERQVSVEKQVIDNDAFPALGEFMDAIKGKISASTAGLNIIYQNQKISDQIFEKLQMHEILAQ